jgi:hypothetical protein
MLLDSLGFNYYNKIRDYIRGEAGNNDREISKEVGAEERGDNNNK